MTLTTCLAPATTPALIDFADRVRSGLTSRRDPHAVAELLSRRPPTAALLDSADLTGRADRAASRIVYAEDMFSVVALVLRPGQQTSIHDHLTWCVVTVLSGTELETRYSVDATGTNRLGQSMNPTGSITALTPPGDIHRVGCAGDEPAISLHVYGADLRRPGSSVRRTYAG